MKYNVEVEHTYSYSIEIEANSPEEAEQKAVLEAKRHGTLAGNVWHEDVEVVDIEEKE
jgi:hypothetical protein